MNNQILVVYSTNSGSTSEVANYIGDTLKKAGASVAVKPVTETENIEHYDTVFIGSPILYGKYMSLIKKFVRTHRETLKQVNVVYFTTCMRLAQVAGEPLPDFTVFVDPVFGVPKPKSEMSVTEKGHRITGYLNAILGMKKDIKPVSISFFRGVLDYNTVGFFIKLLFKVMARMDGLEPGDYRNWEAIRLWTEQTYSRLQVLTDETSK